MIKILEMPRQRKNSKKELSDYNAPLIEDIIKIVVYGDTTNNLSHWISQTGLWLFEINDIKFDGDKKFKPQVYIDEVFDSALGDCIGDSRRNIRKFKLNNATGNTIGRKQYPEFELTQDMVDKVFKISQEFTNIFPKIFATKNDYKVDYFRDMTKKIIECVIK